MTEPEMLNADLVTLFARVETIREGFSLSYQSDRGVWQWRGWFGSDEVTYPTLSATPGMALALALDERNRRAKPRRMKITIPDGCAPMNWGNDIVEAGQTVIVELGTKIGAGWTIIEWVKQDCDPTP